MECSTPGPTKIVEHSVHFYYQFSYDFDFCAFDNAKQRQEFDRQILEAVVNADADPCIKLLAGKSGKVIWKRLTGGRALADVEPHVQALLGNDSKLCLAYQLATQDLVGKHLSIGERGGEKVTKKQNWKVLHTNAAKKRCERDSVDIWINQMRLFVFRTGVAFVEISLRYEGDITDAVLLESNYALTHNHKKGECPVGTINGEDLRELAAALVPALSGRRPGGMKGRANIYTIAKLDRDPGIEALRQLGMRLAQRQTIDYKLIDENTTPHCLTPFSNLCHSAAVEGGSSLIALTPEQKSNFTDTFVAAAGRNTYLPFYIYQLHNHYWLMRHLREIPQEGSAEGLAEDIRLDKKLECIVDFRRYFQFSQISQISVHNAFHYLWQAELKVEQRFKHLNDAAKTIGDHARERRTRWASHITATVAGYLLGSELTESLSRVVPIINLPNILLENLSDVSRRESLRHIAENWDIAILFAGLIGAAGSLYLSWRFNRKAEY